MTSLGHWRLERAPFESGLDPAFFYPSDDHQEAVARLEFLGRQAGSQLGLLTGDIGCGKSLTRAVFAERSRGRRRIAQITSSHLPFPDLLRAILSQLGRGDPGPSAAQSDLERAVERLVAGSELPVAILLDEAQELDRDALVGVRALNNLSDGCLDLTIVLVGQPELRERIQGLPQLDQRTGLRFHLEPLPVGLVTDYLGFRLRVAGHPDGHVFEDAAARLVAERSAGYPRRVNRIARLAMAVAEGRGADRVAVEDVASVVADLDRQRGTLSA